MNWDSRIDREIAERNVIRLSAGLPALGDEERQRLKSARAKRIKEAVFAAERSRFEHSWINNQDGFFANMGRYTKARHQVAAEIHMGKHIEIVLHEMGYRLVDDSWIKDGRRTYVHDEDANRAFQNDLEMAIVGYGWKKHPSRLRSFLNEHTGELIEIEPGGSETSGSFLHLLRGS